MLPLIGSLHATRRKNRAFQMKQGNKNTETLPHNKKVITNGKIIVQKNIQIEHSQVINLHYDYVDWRSLFLANVVHGIHLGHLLGTLSRSYVCTFIGIIGVRKFFTGTLHITRMFPSLDREVVVRALQRSAKRTQIPGLILIV